MITTGNGTEHGLQEREEKRRIRASFLNENN
jgi:hypothetical protein